MLLILYWARNVHNVNITPIPFMEINKMNEYCLVFQNSTIGLNNLKTYSENQSHNPRIVQCYPSYVFCFNLFLQTSYRYAFGELRNETLCPHGASAAAPQCRRAPVYDRPIPFTTKIRDAEDSFSLLTLHYFVEFPMSDKNHYVSSYQLYYNNNGTLIVNKILR